MKVLCSPGLPVPWLSSRVYLRNNLGIEQTEADAVQQRMMPINFRGLPGTTKLKLAAAATLSNEMIVAQNRTCSTSISAS